MEQPGNWFSNYELENLRKRLEEKEAARSTKLSSSAAHRKIRRHLMDKLEATKRENISRVIASRPQVPAFGSSSPRLDTSLHRIHHKDEVDMLSVRYGVTPVSMNATIPFMDPRVAMGPVFTNFEPADFDLRQGRSSPSNPYFGIETAPSSPGPASPSATMRPKTQGCLDWRRSPSPERPPVNRLPYRDDLTYRAVEADANLNNMGKISADARLRSSAFASTTKRFVLPKPQAPDQFHYPIERDTQRWQASQIATSAFNSKTTRESPRIFVPEVKPSTDMGPAYNPDAWPKPSVAKEVELDAARYGAAFRSKDERFKDPKGPYTVSLGPHEFQDAYLRHHGRAVRSFVMGKKA